MRHVISTGAPALQEVLRGEDGARRDGRAQRPRAAAAAGGRSQSSHHITSHRSGSACPPLRAARARGGDFDSTWDRTRDDLRRRRESWKSLGIGRAPRADRVGAVECGNDASALFRRLTSLPARAAARLLPSPVSPREVGIFLLHSTLRTHFLFHDLPHGALGDMVTLLKPCSGEVGVQLAPCRDGSVCASHQDRVSQPRHSHQPSYNCMGLAARSASS